MVYTEHWPVVMAKQQQKGLFVGCSVGLPLVSLCGFICPVSSLSCFFLFYPTFHTVITQQHVDDLGDKYRGNNAESHTLHRVATSL